MNRSSYLFLLVSLALFFSINISAKELSLQDLIANSKKHYPALLNLLSDKKMVEEKINEAIGSFDSQIDISASQRLDGYYDGDDVELKVSKPLQFLNSKIYSSYRKSDGKFPTYNNDLRTLEDGEIKAGVSFSLWRDSFIDSKRLKVRNSILENKKIVAVNFFQEQLIISELSKAYWDWITKGKIYYVHKELLGFAIARNKNLKKRIKAGDLSKIYEIENLQYIVKRRGIFLNSLKNYLKSSLNLSLFYRGNDGTPLKIEDSNFPKNIDFSPVSLDLAKDLKSVSVSHPKIIELETELNQLNNDETFRKNSLNPSLDIDLSMSQDYGDSVDSFDRTIEEQEAKALISMNIPLERNLVRSQLAQVKIKKRLLNRKTQLAQDSITAKVKSLYVDIENLEKIIEQSILEIKYADLLVKAEIKKFNKGSSDFFLINIREQYLADAKITKWSKINEFYSQLASYRAITRTIK